MKIKRSELKQLAITHIGDDSLGAQNQIVIKIATARAARLSYMTFDGEIDYEKDIKLHDKLLKDKHASPFEHCARVPTEFEYVKNVKGSIADMVCENDNYWIEDEDISPKDKNRGWFDNFKGWQSYRNTLKL